MTETMYFGYGTYLDDEESLFYLPGAKKIVTAVAKNRAFEFHAHEGNRDRGYCHISDKAGANNSDVYGIIFKHDPKYFVDYEGFERCFLTVYGADGKTYECWTLRMTKTGMAVRPPHYYWKHITIGLKLCSFPSDYVSGIYNMYEKALPCEDADRPNPNLNKKSFFTD